MHLKIQVKIFASFIPVGCRRQPKLLSCLYLFAINLIITSRCKIWRIIAYVCNFPCDFENFKTHTFYIKHSETNINIKNQIQHCLVIYIWAIVSMLIIIIVIQFSFAIIGIKPPMCLHNTQSFMCMQNNAFATCLWCRLISRRLKEHSIIV
jgi:hypothetical protein